jgi:hypothetical protein
MRQSGLVIRRMAGDRTFETSGTRIAASVPAGGFDTARGQVDRSLRAIYRDPPLTVSTAVRSDSFTPPGQENPAA